MNRIPFIFFTWYLLRCGIFRILEVAELDRLDKILALRRLGVHDLKMSSVYEMTSSTLSNSATDRLYHSF